MLLTLLTLVAQAATPALPPLNAMQQGALTCSAAFALDARRSGSDEAQQGREREFFVRSLAQIMDETAADRDTIVALVGTEATRLAAAPEDLDAILPACRSLLESSGIR